MAQIGIRNSYKIVTLGDIPVGNLFMKNGSYYINTDIRIIPNVNLPTIDISDYSCVVNLQSGAASYMSDDEIVIKINNSITLDE